MNVRHRPLARLGAAALLASGVFAALPAPASAAPAGADLSIEAIVGTKVAEGARYKSAYAKVSNNGPGTPTSLVVKADTSQIDFDEVAVFPAGGDCSGEGSTKPELWTCVIPQEEIPGPGETVELPIVLIKRSANVDEPYTGPITMTIESPDDTTPDNNSADAQIVISKESGVDLRVLAADVTKRLTEDFDPDEVTEAPLLYPGESTVLYGEVANSGDAVADGLSLTVSLPAGVTFDGTFEGCEHDAANRTAVCRAEEIQLQTEGDGIGFVFPIVVGADVTAPVVLKPGSVTASALRTLPASAKGLRKPGTAKLPEVMKVAPAATLTVDDVDPSDNVDDFAVIVAAKPNGGGGGNPGDGTPGGGGGTDGGLPVTGPQAGLIGGIGVAVLVAGGVMFVISRRRRVILVAPADERPTA
ncbi:hypothetical protein [Micromonospora sp. NPDC049301]|uniref:hypothetical protein n=1 Tax=Micromonospora sp. NPDC049301 TaxID=3155723 RepID=UPI0034206A18